MIHIAYGWDAVTPDHTIIVVDVLRFTSMVATAVHYGMRVAPSAKNRVFDVPDPVSVRHARGADFRKLSPLEISEADRGTSVVVPSPNGSAASDALRDAPVLMAGCLLNAKAVADAALAFGRDITIVACGELNFKTGERRRALEDTIGAAAIAYYAGSDDLICEKFLLHKSRLDYFLLSTTSGVELIHRGRRDEVLYCAQLNHLSSVPILKDGAFKALVEG
jgi:2-phosphosulfolactate phosphatase